MSKQMWKLSKFRGHGEVFQNILQNLTQFAYYELDYKPKLAVAAGIRKPEELK